MMERGFNSYVEFDNGVALQFDIDQGIYRGLRSATLDGEVFLVQGRGSLPYFTTPTGIVYLDFKLRGCEITGDSATLECEAVGRVAPVQQNLDFFHFPCISGEFSSAVSDLLRVRIIARTLVVSGEEYRGFEIAYEFESRGREIHWLYESVSLAPNGRLLGAHVMGQNMTAGQSPLESILDKDTFYSTEENYGSVCIQSPARGGGSHIFDLVQGKDQAVVSFFESAAVHGKALKANFQTRFGEDFVTSSDFHYGKLANVFASAPRVVLAVRRSSSSRADGINRWTKWFEYTGDLWREELGIRRTASVPTLTFEGTGFGGVDAGTTYPDLLKVWGKRLDWVAEQGFRAINLHTPEWISAANQKTLVFGGNNCSPWEFKLSDFLGGEEELRLFCDACRSRGIKVYVWIAGHLQRESPVWREHPEWITRSPNNSLWDGHYGMIHSLSFVHGASDWILRDLESLRENTGIDGVWLDSFAGMVLHPINWQSPEREPNAPAVLRFLGALSQAGFEIQIEGMSQLGVSSWGNLEVDQISGHEEVLLDTNLRYYLCRHWRDTPITSDLYFRMLAARAPMSVWLEEFLERRESFPLDLPQWFAPMTRAYNKISPRMHSRTLMRGGALWKDESERPSAYFAFETSILDLPDVQIQDLGSNRILSETESVIEGHMYEVL